MNVKAVKNLSSILVGAFALTDIVRFIEFIIKIVKQEDVSLTGSILIQSVYILGILSVVIFYGMFVINIEKGGVFTHQNQKLLKVFGIIILSSGLSSALLFSWFTDIPDAGSRMLGIIGGTLIFISFVFKMGIKMQEEQDLTI